MKAIKTLGFFIFLITLTYQSGYSQTHTLTDSVKQFIEDSFRDFSNSNYSDWEGLAVTITYNDQYWSTTIGKANDTGKSVDENGKWLFRSFTKLIVSTVIMQLYEEELIDIKAPIGQYLDPIQKVNMDDTIEDLLQMRSRMCQYMNSSSSVWIEVAQNQEAILDTKTMLENHLPSGSCNSSQGFDYNDANFQVLGLVIEAVTGKSGEEVFNERIFNPYEMQNTSLAPIDLTRDDFNGIYSGDFDDSTPHDQSENSLNAALTSQKFSAGVMGSTYEMLKFLKHLMDGDILEAETLELMQVNPSSSNYGMGLMIQTMSGMNGNIPVYDGSYYGHGGGGLNTSRSFYDPVRKIGFSYAFNSSSNTPQSDYNTEYFKEATYYYLRTCIENGGCSENTDTNEIPESLKNSITDIMNNALASVQSKGLAVSIDINGARWSTSVGNKDTELNPIELDDRFLFMSFTKTQTATVVLQLHEEGLLDIDNSLDQYIDPVSNVNMSITLRELLTMTASTCSFLSGNDSYWDFFYANLDSVATPESILNDFVPAGNCNPNNDYFYNDTNFELLGLVIEAVTGNSGQTEFENRIYTPLQLSSAELAPLNSAENSFNGVWWNNENGTPIDQSSASKNLLLTSRKFSAGSVMNTSDALTLIKGLLEGDLLSENMLEDMKTPASASVPDDATAFFRGYGLGLMKLSSQGGDIYYGHSGGGGNATRTIYNPDKKIGVVTAGNYRNDFQSILPYSREIYDTILSCISNGECITVSNEIEETDLDDPYSISLSQNYPNPFNPSTSISFELPEAGLIQLKVYNLLGQEVANLVDGKMNSGTHTVNFDASQLSSGVYIYRLVAGNQSITKKMMLIK